MPVTGKDVERIAKLARLEFSAEEKEKLAVQLNRILEYVAKLNELDTTNVEPLSHVVEVSNALREDRVVPGLTPDEALKNAPGKSGQFFKVPKVFGREEES